MIKRDVYIDLLSEQSVLACATTLIDAFTTRAMRQRNEKHFWPNN